VSGRSHRTLYMCEYLYLLKGTFTSTFSALSHHPNHLFPALKAIMRLPSFVLAFLLVAISFLPLTYAAPWSLSGVLHLYKRQTTGCSAVHCRVEEPGVNPVNNSTPSAMASPTPTAPSSPTAVEPQLVEASSTPSSGPSSSSANAGVALASRGSLYCIVLAGLLGMVLSF